MKSVLLLFCIFISFTSNSQNYSGTITQTVFLVGNTDGAVSFEHLKILRTVIQEQTAPVTLIYSGDILNKKGASHKINANDSAFIQSLLDVVKGVKNATVYFVPGDEDLNNSKKNSWNELKQLEELINGLAGKKVFLPEDGCPGPAIVDFANNLQLIFISTPWWINSLERTQAPDTRCEVLVESQFIEELEGALEDAKDKNVLMVGHHPVISNGNYGGRVPIFQHLNPPVIGTFVAAYHKNIGTPKDIAYPAYAEFAKNMKQLMQDYTPFIYASSHDYNLQALSYENSYQVVSGSISKKVNAGKTRNTVYKSDEFGFVKLAYHDDGKVMMDGYEFQKDNSWLVQSTELYQSICNPDSSEAPVNSRFVPCKEKITTTAKMNAAFADSISTVFGGTEYKAGFMKKIFLGPLYRTSWTANIQVPFLNLDTTKGGLTATGTGGGRQTHSLSFIGGDGKSYAFRSVNKDPIKALDPLLRKTFMVALARQLTATQNPYGALPVSFLLNATTVFHAQPVLYILPDDPKLGLFQKEFGSMLGMLEEKPKNGKGKEQGSFGADNIVRSFDLFKKLYKDHHNSIDAIAYARARMFDIWIGDWGRHEDNWKWAGFKTGDKTIYYPIPRDRDHAFSLWNGLIPYLADRKWAKPNIEHFNAHFGDMKSATWPSRHLDRFLLSSLDKNQWLLLTKELQLTMNDQLIDSAVQQFPKETIPLSGTTIGTKLKSRRNELTKGIEKYYDLLAKHVDVVGSNKAEYFLITSFENGNVEVTMFEKDKSTNGPSGAALYHRMFIPHETKSINIYGLNSDDVFVVEGASTKKIIIRLLGGKGNDRINNSSQGKKIRIYEYKHKKQDSIPTPQNSRVVLSNNRNLVEYNRESFHYNTWIPLPFLSYSTDDGFIAGFDYLRTIYQFGNQQYTDKLKLSIRASTKENLQFKFSNEYHHAIKKCDWLIGGEIAQPYPAVYFYGAGNETGKLQTESIAYYRSRFKGYNAFTGLQQKFWVKSRFNVNLYYKYYAPKTLSENNRNHDAELFGNKALGFIGAEAILDLDFRDNTFAPKHGVRLVAKQSINHHIQTSNKNFTKREASLEFYQTSKTIVPLTFGIKAGIANSEGDIPFYEIHTLGRQTGLHGYNRDRFAGTTVAYLNNQLTIEFGSVQNAIAPLTIGAFGFYDVGRAWIPDEKSNTWHSGYGGGLYFIPLFEMLTTKILISFSPEAKSGLFEFGLGLKL